MCPQHGIRLFIAETLVNYYRKNDYSSDRGKFDHLLEKYLTHYRDIVEGSI